MRIYVKGYCGTLLLVWLTTQSFLVFTQPGPLQSLALKLERHKTEDTVRVHLLNQLAYASFAIRIADLKSYGEQALSLAEKLKDTAGQAEANRMIGLGFLVDKNSTLAFTYFGKSLKGFQEIGNKTGEIQVMNHIGRYYLYRKEYNLASTYLFDALAEARQNRYVSGEAHALQIFGELYIAQRDFESASKSINSSLELARQIKDSMLVSSVYTQFGRLLLMEKKYDQSVLYLNKALDYFERNTNLLGQFNSEELLGDVYLAQKKYSEAGIYYTECKELSHQYGSMDLLSKTFNHLTMVDSLQGNYKMALRHFTQFMQLKDSLNQSERNRQTLLFETRFETERKHKENLVLHLQQVQNKAIIKQQFFGLFILVLAFIGLVIILIKLRRLNVQNEATLTVVLDKNQEIMTKNGIIEEQRLQQVNINLVKDKLFSVISHDMRTPLTQLQGILSLMEVNALKMSEWTELLPALKRNVQTSTEQLDTLLVWSKNQMQGFQPHITQFDIHRLTEKNYLLLRMTMEEKNIGFVNTIDPGLMVEADQEMIQIVLRNLMTNAIKFTQNNGKIHLSHDLSATHVRIKVHDTGVGIREENLDKLFDEIDFTTPGTLGEKGTGLGLKLCRDFVVMNKGEIRVDSIPGSGSTFAFTIPLAIEVKLKFSQEVG